MESALMSILPIITTISYLSRDPNFNWIHSLPYILPSCIPLLTILPNWRMMYEKSILCMRYRKTSTFTATINLKVWGNEPESVVRCFSNVLWYWNKENLTVNCKNLKEESNIRSYYYDDEKEDTYTPPLFIDDPTHAFWSVQDPSIRYKMWLAKTFERDGQEIKELCLQIEFPEQTPPNKIVEHVDYIRNESKRILSEQKKKQCVLVSKQRDSDKEHDSTGPSFMTYNFDTTSSFDNFFCEEAQIVKKDLEYFLQSKNEYQRLGKPWTYTILNEGPPGVGKTKLVKSIAKRTGYTLIVLNLAHIPNSQVLYEAFHTSVLGGESVPHDKRLYYIPEVDTQLCEIRKNVEEPMIILPPDKNKKITNLHEIKPTLGEILNVLDGVPERHGHILVLDTNHLMDLDPALVRPGRVDRILKWKKMSSSSIKQYLENYYKTVVPKRFRFPDRYITAAELQAHVTKYMCMSKCIAHFSDLVH